ncbi:hypothetical protein U9M48_019563 [Paspalum notatum var. saurae]|uniref:Uncharacterized protein n=1 Tax=Paspalum notatum var. saurae TaxID=547442 RepID=A0AAQ3TBM0_PASNO
MQQEGALGEKGCRAPRKERANLTQDEDEDEEDAALPLTIATVDLAPICPEPEDVLVAPIQGIHINEPKARVFLAADDDEEPLEG